MSSNTREKKQAALLEDGDKVTSSLESESSNGNSNGATGATITDPSGRFERSDELLGRGASKHVYKAFDLEEGKEVAWNELIVDRLTEASAVKILSEIKILTGIDNENIIKFYHSWIIKNSAGFYKVFFITELMSSGTLRNYLSKTNGPIKLKIVKGWMKQVLAALSYLHSKEPPIIHRDLKGDNIFINGNNGQTKLGDFGLAVLKNQEMLKSVLGTPEFMAPELYDELYDEKVDIYAFGMCLLEMLTKEYPYCECDNPAQIYRKVTQGVKPAGLNKVEDEKSRAFIELCIDSDPRNRPSVQELLDHPFMQIGDKKGDDSVCPSPTNNQFLSDCKIQVVSLSLPIVNLVMNIFTSTTSNDDPSTPIKNSSEIKFPFNFENDTVGAVIDEMIKENVLIRDEDSDLVSERLKDALREPLAAYEIELAKVPARSEISPMVIETASSTTQNEENDKAESQRINHNNHQESISETSSSPSPNQQHQQQNNNNGQLNTQHEYENVDESQEAIDEEDEMSIHDHPKVGALLLRQKKEIELLALFHRREHQTLLKSLQRQQRKNTKSRQSSIVTPPISIEEEDSIPFINKARNLMYESTGNAAWLPATKLDFNNFTTNHPQGNSSVSNQP